MTHYAGEQIRASHFFDMISFTPTIANYGSATFTTNSGVYVRIGDLVWTNMYIVVGSVGSGTSNVTIEMPAEIPISRSRRQMLPANSEGGFATTGNLTGCLVSFTSGSGSIWDRIRLTNNSGSDAIENVTGADLRAGMILCVEGVYRSY